jgi:DNA-directed RNA polymerase sigma subunit (sigma70/sigma32)
VRSQPSFWPSLLWHSSSGSPSAGKPQDAEWLKQLGSVTSSDTLDGTLAQPDGVALAASKVVASTEQDVVDMSRRLGGDVSLNAPIRQEGDSSEWQDWLVDEMCDQETRLAESEESDHRRKDLGEAL